jgi:CRISPR/Cas system-associated endonuclease Cas1
MKTKTVKITLESFGSHLGMEKGCFIVKDREGKTERYPLFENLIDEIRIKSGNSISSGALASCGFWGIDCLFLTQKGRPVAMLKSLDDDGHVEQRIAQYQALNSGKGLHIAKQIVLGKIIGENLLLQKYSLKQHDLMDVKRKIDDIVTSDLRLLRCEALILLETKITNSVYA